jgi:hypothetical protein
MTQDTHTELERVALAIHEARFASPKHPRAPEPMDATDEEYCFRLARAAIEALPARTDERALKLVEALRQIEHEGRLSADEHGCANCNAFSEIATAALADVQPSGETR